MAQWQALLDDRNGLDRWLQERWARRCNHPKSLLIGSIKVYPMALGFWADKLELPTLDIMSIALTNHPYTTLCVDWPDGGIIPLPLLHGLIGIAKTQRRLAVGCVGGHGRTGTFLACLYVAYGMRPKVAIGRVRGLYCPDAIETRAQENLVAQYHDYIQVHK